MTIREYINKTMGQIYKDTAQVQFTIGLNNQGEVDMQSTNTITFTLEVNKSNKLDDATFKKILKDI